MFPVAYRRSHLDAPSRRRAVTPPCDHLSWSLSNASPHLSLPAARDPNICLEGPRRALPDAQTCGHVAAPTNETNGGFWRMVVWVLSIAISIALLAITAGARGGDLQMAYFNMAVAILVNAVFAFLAVRSNAGLRAAGASRSAIAADIAKSMSYVWIWGTLGLAVVYGTGILAWKEWWHFLAAFMAASGICLYSTVMLQRRADAGVDDEALLKRGHYATIAQLVGMIIVIVGLLVDGKMQRFLVERYTDWAANNIFFFGSCALALISIYSLMTRDRQPT